MCMTMLINENIERNLGGYSIIYSDPAWKQTKGNKRKCRPNQGKLLDYETMSLEDIKEVHRQVSTLCDDNHNIFMWTIDKYLHETEQMMKELGYELHARFVWDKENGVAPAFTVRFSHEYLLWFYKKGHILMPDEAVRGKFTTVLRERSTVHSKKPECAYRMIETMFPTARKLEMFARSVRCGWDAWGNQVGIFDKNLYKLTATISKEGEEDIVVSFFANTLEEVKDESNFNACIENARKCFGISDGEIFVDYIIEQNDEYIDSDFCAITISNNKVIELEAC